jgi:hypothetical protein
MKIVQDAMSVGRQAPSSILVTEDNEERALSEAAVGKEMIKSE